MKYQLQNVSFDFLHAPPLTVRFQFGELAEKVILDLNISKSIPGVFFYLFVKKCHPSSNSNTFKKKKNTKCSLRVNTSKSVFSF